jgi:hypothetical protein
MVYAQVTKGDSSPHFPILISNYAYITNPEMGIENSQFQIQMITLIWF